jgi:hypothetical protein
MECIINSYKILFRTPQRKRSLPKLRVNAMMILKMELKLVWFEDVNWVQTTRERRQ